MSTGQLILFAVLAFWLLACIPAATVLGRAAARGDRMHRAERGEMYGEVVAVVLAVGALAFIGGAVVVALGGAR